MTYIKNMQREIRSKVEVLSTGELTPAHCLPPPPIKGTVAGQQVFINYTLTSKIQDK